MQEHNQPVAFISFTLLATVLISGCAVGRFGRHRDRDQTSDDRCVSSCPICSSHPTCAAPAAGCCAPLVPLDAMTPQSMPLPFTEPATTQIMAPAITEPQTDIWAPRHISPPVTQPNCEQQLQDARAEFDRKLGDLESRFEDERRNRQSLQASLQSMNSEVGRLSGEVDYWREEIKRIDRTTAEQHRSDMASLQAISDMIDHISATSSSGSTKR
ncbi:MAG: hypothetical protein KDA89_16470 [Planctomycetaceae bacterium]|nr:hypothetical protein [Planctomycetaceae bacterium]